ncbi:hypothetical protein [Jatrophihabitans fulvus]
MHRTTPAPSRPLDRLRGLRRRAALAALATTAHALGVVGGPPADN